MSENDFIDAVTRNAAYFPAFVLGLSLHSYAILLLFIFLDVVTGVLRAGVLRGWRSVTSSRLAGGIIAKMCIIGVPVVLVLAGRGVGIDMAAVAKGCLGMLILSEAYSILGNVHSIYVRQDLPEFDAISFVLGKVRFAIERVIKPR